MMNGHLAFPTGQHQEAADIAAGFFLQVPEVDTFLVVNSCARGQAIPESDLDLAVLVDPHISPERQWQIETDWNRFSETNASLSGFRRSGRFRAIHLDLFDGQYQAAPWDDAGGPDTFEIEIGNQIAYSTPLLDEGPRFVELKETWLPYYGEPLRASRLSMVLEACYIDLDYAEFYAARSLYFQAFDRFYKAYMEFLQGFFIARRRYPLAYNKWIHEQLIIEMRLDELYEQVLGLFAIPRLDDRTLVQKAALLRELVEAWCFL